MRVTRRDFTTADLAALVELNRLRAGGPGSARDRLELHCERAFSASTRLAVYGTLAPGRSNHHQLGHLAGTWSDGDGHDDYSVTGERFEFGWGAAAGFPALRWAPTGSPVAVQLFVSPELPDHWTRLDAFEGDEYLRILVPVLAGSTVAMVANLYAARL